MHRLYIPLLQIKGPYVTDFGFSFAHFGARADYASAVSNARQVDLLNKEPAEMQRFLMLGKDIPCTKEFPSRLHHGVNMSTAIPVERRRGPRPRGITMAGVSLGALLTLGVLSGCGNSASTQITAPAEPTDVVVAASDSPTPTETTPQPSPSTSCLTVGKGARQWLDKGVHAIDPANSLGRAVAARDPERENVFIIAGEVLGPGMDPGSAVAIWATNGQVTAGTQSAFAANGASHGPCVTASFRNPSEGNASPELCDERSIMPALNRVRFSRTRPA